MSATVANLPLHEVMVSNILERYHSATPAQIHDGEHWYDEAREYCSALASTSGVQLETVAAMVALTSLKTPWSDNKRRAARVVAAYVKGEAIPSVHFGAQMKKIGRVLAGGNPHDIVNGPKEGNFFRNLIGDHEVCTVDRWAYLTATGMRVENGGLGKGINTRLQAAYNEAASILRIPVAILQAVVWVVERGSAV